MQVYLLRHGIAEEARLGKSDADRELTAEGRRKLKDTLRLARQAEVKPSLIIASPLVRAWQTAQVAAEVLSYSGQILRSKVLVPNARYEQVWDEIRVHQDQSSLLLVGHDPLFSYLSGYLLGALDIHIDFKKGAMLRVDFESFGPKPKGILRWFLTAKLAAKGAVPAPKGAKTP